MNHRVEKPGRTLIRRYRIEVVFHQVDMMQVVHNVQYFLWFEQGRFALINEIMDADPAEKARLLTPVVMNHCDYLEPARLGDQLVVTTKHTLLPSWTGRFQFAHSISNTKTKAEMVSGFSTVTFVDAATFKPIKEIPKTIWNSYQNLR